MIRERLPIGPFDTIDSWLSLCGLGLVAAYAVTPLDGRTPLVVAAYALLLGTSTLVVTQGLAQFTGDDLGDDADIDEDTGWLIGKLENVLVLALVLQGAYTALSIIFAAKSFIRREDISSGNTTYYLAGTLLNFTYSVGYGMALTKTLEAVL